MTYDDIWWYMMMWWYMIDSSPTASYDMDAHGPCRLRAEVPGLCECDLASLGMTSLTFHCQCISMQFLWEFTSSKEQPSSDGNAWLCSQSCGKLLQSCRRWHGNRFKFKRATVQTQDFHWRPTGRWFELSISEDLPTCKLYAWLRMYIHSYHVHCPREQRRWSGREP